MKTIWKFELEVIDRQLIEMPFGAEILDIQIQQGKPCLWARVDPQAEKEKRLIITHGTGHPVSSNTGQHIGSYQMLADHLVFHVFDEAQNPQ